ncbi:MAG: Mur ligase family protein [Thermomonas sp.]
MSAVAMQEPFEDSRRLTGANLYFDGAGAALEVPSEPAPGLAFDVGALQRWRANISRARALLHWPDDAIVAREHATGASLAFEAPFDQLYIATEVNEWALYSALDLHASDAPVDDEAESPRPHVAHFDDDEALRQLQAFAAVEAKPALRALVEAARTRGVPAHADDDALSIGEGHAAQAWTLDALPAIDDVPWSRLHAIPKAVVTGSNGKTTTVRLLAAMLRAHGLHAGYSSTDGLFIDGERVEAGDYSGPVGARTVLRDARVDAAVLETARGGLLRRGLVASDARVAVVTNVAADHFGEYGIHTLDHIAAVKLVVAKSLVADGLLVLNADDPMLVAHAPSSRAIAWFALRLDDAAARGLPACGVREGRLILATEIDEHDLGVVAAMPLTVGGAARYNIANIAAASLAAHALDIAATTIAGVLTRFGASNADNPGRLQRWTLGDVNVLLDYAHNPDGLRGLLDVASGLRRGGRLALLLGHAGNRLESDFHALAAVAADAKPDRVWLKDIGGDYLRGRASGDVAMILRDALLASGMADADLPVCLDEAQASREALAWAQAGDLLVLPVHELARRDEVVALLDRLQAEGWRAGEPLPEDA